MQSIPPELETPPTEPQRVTISLPPDAIEFLKKEATRSGVSMADALRRAIATEKFIQEQRKLGAEVFIKDRSGAPRQLVFKD